MAVNLSKGGRVNLSKEAPGLQKVRVGLGWDPNISDTGTDFDLDASVFVLGADGKVLGDEWFIFYNQLKSPDGAIVHQGDNRTGEGEGDDEVIEIDLSKLDNRVERLVFVVTIHEAEQRKQNFGQVNNSYIRIVNVNDNNELMKYELDEDYSVETAMNFGELYKKDGEWRFKAVGEGFKGGLADFAKMYGVNI